MAQVITKILTLLIFVLAAPEARRLDEKLQRCNLKIKQNVDIWSLSCVFSEVATWVNKGWDQLNEYRNRRIDEMEQRTGKREDCFHDGLTVLTAVRQSHDDVIASCRADDPITPEVVRNVIHDMLLFKEEQRPKASFMYYKSRRVIDDADAKIRCAQSPALAATQGIHPGPIDAKGPPLKDPPNFPPDHERHWAGEATLLRRPYAGPKTWVPKSLPSPEGNGRVLGGSARASRQSYGCPDDHTETYEQGSSTTAHSPSLRPASGHDGYSGRRHHGHSSSHDSYNQHQEAHNIPSDIDNKDTGQAAYDNNSPSDLSEVSHRVALNKALRGRNSQDRSFQTLSHSNPDVDQEDTSWANTRRDTSHAVAMKSGPATTSGDMGANQNLSKSGRDFRASGNRKSETQLPEMSVGDGLTLKRRGHKFPREDLFMELQARDHVRAERPFRHFPRQGCANSKCRRFLLITRNLWHLIDMRLIWYLNCCGPW